MGSPKKSRTRAGSRNGPQDGSPPVAISAAPKRILKRHGTAPLSTPPTSPVEASKSQAPPQKLGAADTAKPLIISPKKPKSAAPPPLTSNSLLSQMSNSTQPSILSPHTRAQKQAAVDDDRRMESLWAEMQDTLDEVELNVAASRPRVFGKVHAERLEELRKAQVALAAAWGRGEGEDGEADRRDGKEEGVAGLGGEAKAEQMVSGNEKRQADEQMESIEEEAEGDMAAAKRRREVNDRYFERVNRGVKEVVKRLATVAAAMEGVEKESREIWGDDESLRSVKT